MDLVCVGKYNLAQIIKLIIEEIVPQHNLIYKYTAAGLKTY